MRSSALAPPPAAALCARARALGLSSSPGECGAPSRWAGAKLFRGAEEKRWGEGERRRGQGSGAAQWKELGRGARGVGYGSRRLGSPARPCLDSGGPLGSCRRAVFGCPGSKPFAPEGGAAALTCAFSGSPPPPPASQRDGGPRRPWAFEPLPSAPAGQGPAVPGGRTKVLAGGTGRERDLLDLDLRGHFPSSWIWARSPHPEPPPIESPSPFLSAFSPLGRFCVLEAGMNLGRCSCSGRCLFGSPSCILSRRQLLAEESDEYTAVEQVVPEMEIGKPVVSSYRVSLVRKWAFSPNQPALIQTYRMPRERSWESCDRKDMVSTPVQSLCGWENKSHKD